MYVGVFVFERDDRFLAHIHSKIATANQSLSTAQDELEAYFHDWTSISFETATFSRSCLCHQQQFGILENAMLVRFVSQHPAEIWSKVKFDKDL
jgi:hypothetical protein